METKEKKERERERKYLCWEASRGHSSPPAQAQASRRYCAPAAGYISSRRAPSSLVSRVPNPAGKKKKRFLLYMVWREKKGRSKVVAQGKYRRRVNFGVGVGWLGWVAGGVALSEENDRCEGGVYVRSGAR